MRRSLSYLWACLILAPLLMMPTATHAQGNQRCFPETGYCISGAIRTYWERNGGLAVFGYPIGSLLIDRVEDTWEGPTQWFERDRLEDHTNEGKGVLAGRLGAQSLLQRGTDWQQLPGEEGPQTGCRYFSETQLNVCQPFLRYWERNGGLERFGYPLTSMREEQIEGRAYQVQYFERRRMELHPEHAGTDSAVLLGLLGRDLYNTAGNGTHFYRQLIADYLEHLAMGRYAEAAMIFGGPYDFLRSANPDVSRNDSAQLLKRACTTNGFVCLPLLRIVGEQRLDAEQIRFDVELRDANGTRFVDRLNGRTSFQFVVRHALGSAPVVLDLPPLVR